MKKTHVKAGDEVVVITGNAKGKNARVVQVIKKKDRVLLESLTTSESEDQQDFINPIWKTTRPTQEQQERERIQVEAPIHISNVMKKETWSARQARRAS